MSAFARRGSAIVAWSTIALAACSLAPHDERPAPAIPASWPVGDAYLKNSEATLPDLGYRDLFTDPRLVALIERALANNQDLRVALANVDAARGTLRVQRAALLPDIEAGAGVTKTRTGPESSTTGVPTRTTTRYDINAGLSAFEVDLFGRVRSLSDAALNDYLGTEAAVRATRLTLAAEVANAYATLATDRSLLAIANETETLAKRSVDLTRARLSGGVAPRTDLRQAETIYAQARSDRAALITQVAQDRNALVLLVGAAIADDELPSSIDDVEAQLRELPAGLDSRVLLKRPDVVQAEYALRAANARIGAARAAYFPTISLTAVAGLASGALSSLFTGGAFTWTVAPAASLTLFDFGTRRGNVEISEANRDAAVAQYQKAIQTAFREVSDALARRGTIDDQLAAQVELDAAARDTYVLADARYREGVDSFLANLDAQRTQYTARKSLASTRLLHAQNLIELYRSLGGSTQ